MWSRLNRWKRPERHILSVWPGGHAEGDGRGRQSPGHSKAHRGRQWTRGSPQSWARVEASGVVCSSESLQSSCPLALQWLMPLCGCEFSAQVHSHYCMPPSGWSAERGGILAGDKGSHWMLCAILWRAPLRCLRVRRSTAETQVLTVVHRQCPTATTTL